MGMVCVTFFAAHFVPEKELIQAVALAQSAKQAGIKHAIWSTFEDTRKLVPLTDNHVPTLMDKYKVPQLDAKGEALLATLFNVSAVRFGAAEDLGFAEAEVQRIGRIVRESVCGQ